MIPEIILALLFILGGLLVSLMHGGWQPPGKLARIIDDYSLEAFLLAGPILPLLLMAGASWWLALPAALLGAFVGVRKGHGQYMTLPYSKKMIDREDVDILLIPFFGKDPRTEKRFYGGVLDLDLIEERIHAYGKKKLRRRNIAGLALTGGLVTFFASCVLISMGYWVASLLLLGGGIMKALGYVIGWRLWPSNEEDNATQFGEGFRGASLFAFYVLALGFI